MPRGNSAASRDIAFHLHPYTHLKKQESEGPLVITEGKGIHVYDENGKEYIEGMAGLWCTALGFGEERLVEAATRQLKRLPYYHIFNQKSHEGAAELAERIIGLMPVPMSKVFFNNSGSEANDSAVKMVWYYNNARGRYRKKKIIARMKGYHGVTVASASLTGLANNHRDFDLPIAHIRHADCPHHYRFAKPGESEEDFATRLADSLEAQILREDPETVAAFIAEPVMGAGGVIPPPRDIFRQDPEGAEEIRRAADRRRGDLRLRPDGQDVRHRDLWAEARHHDHGQGALLGLSADLRHGDHRGALPGLRRAEREDRHLRPRLHLLGASRLLRRGAGDAEDLRRARHPRPCAEGDAPPPGGACAASPATGWWARCAAWG